MYKNLRVCCGPGWNTVHRIKSELLIPVC
jgi:hypothetical protein